MVRDLSPANHLHRVHGAWDWKHIDTVLPLAKKHHVGANAAALVYGKVQSYLPWESWDHPYILDQPPVWFHDIFYPDGRPYRPAEIKLIRELTGKSSASDTH